MLQLSINLRKLFASLSQTKYRRERGLFCVEGQKSIGEMLESPLTELVAVIATREWWDDKHEWEVPIHVEHYQASSKELKQISTMVTAPDVIGVFRIPKTAIDFENDIKGKLVLALDDVRDPGNMGTIIRLSDWWGVETILCSSQTVDCYNPKVVQSAMGALGRVKVVKVDSLASLLADFSSRGIKIYGTFMNGENLFDTQLSDSALLVMGNEGNGISKEIEDVVTERLTIPSYPPGRPHVESLNVATATAITLAQFRIKK